MKKPPAPKRQPSALAIAFGRRVKDLRQGLGAPTGPFAAAVGITEEWLRRIENGSGSPSMETIEALAGVLRIPCSALFPTEGYDPGRYINLITAAERLSDPELRWLEEVIRVALDRPYDPPWRGNDAIGETSRPDGAQAPIQREGDACSTIPACRRPCVMPARRTATSPAKAPPRRT